MAIAKQKHSDVDPAFLETLDRPFSTSWDYFKELAAWGYTEADIPELWRTYVATWLRNGRWDPDAFQMDRPEALAKWGEHPV